MRAPAKKKHDTKRLFRLLESVVSRGLWDFAYGMEAGSPGGSGGAPLSGPRAPPSGFEC